MAELSERAVETEEEEGASAAPEPANRAVPVAAADDGRPPAAQPSLPDQGGNEPPAPRSGLLRSRRLRLIVLPIVGVIALAALLIGVNAYVNSLWYVSTDNAQVTGTPVPLGLTNAGTVEQIPVQVGEFVQHGQLLASVLLPVQSNSAPIRAAVVAPFDSVVIGIPVGVGATVTPGQGIVTVVDPRTVYVAANIDETAVKRVAPGQPVDVHLDALNTTVSGVVDSITPASAATFSLLPQANTTGSFTKVAQLVPVKIDIDASQGPLPVGTSAEVKIHVAPGH